MSTAAIANLARVAAVTLNGLEREHGQARLLVGDERRRVAKRLRPQVAEWWWSTLVVDIGEGRIVTCGPRGESLLIHPRRDATGDLDSAPEAPINQTQGGKRESEAA